MRISGLAKADKKSGRIAAEGVVAIETSDDGKAVAMAEINSETDFVAKADDFTGFARSVCKAVLAHNPADVEALGGLDAGGSTIEQIRQELVSKLGENIQVRRFVRHDMANGTAGVYKHGERIGVVTEVSGSEELARDIAMHVAASRPVCIGESDVPAGVLEQEKKILVAEAAESGKPAEIIEKMVEGRLRKYLAEITLVGQPFVKNPDQTVEKLLKSEDEVMAQVKGD